MKSYTTLLVLFFSALIVISCSRSHQRKAYNPYNSDSAKLDEHLRRTETEPRAALHSTASTTSSASTHDASKAKEGKKHSGAANANNKWSNSTRHNDTEADHDNESDSLFGMITAETGKIHNQICHQRLEIKDTLNQISNQLKMTKDKIVGLQSKAYSKQKLYLKFALVANMINMSTSELKRVEDLIEILKCASCDRLNDLIEKFNSVSSIPENLVNMSAQAMQQTKVQMNFAYSK